MDSTRIYVRIDTGYGPPDDKTPPIQLHVAAGTGVLRLTVEDAETLSDQLRLAAQAVRTLTGRPQASAPAVFVDLQGCIKA